MTSRRIALIGLCAFWSAANLVAQDKQDAKPGATPAAKKGGAPKIKLSAAEWNFGVKWYGEPCAGEVSITNEGTAPLRINRMRTSCGCTVARPTSGGTWNGKVLQPGESDKIALTYNTRKGVKKVSQKVTIESNDPVQPRLQLSVAGEVKNVYDMKPASRVIFPRLERDSKTTQTIEMTNNMDKPVFLKLKPSKAKSPFDIKLEEVEAGQKYKLVVATLPPLKTGANNTKVEIATGVERIPTMSVNVSAYITARVSVSPPRLFVSPKLTKAYTKTIRVSYRADKPIKITKIESASDKVTAELLPPPANARPNATTKWHQIKVSLPPANELPEDGTTLTIYTDDPSPEYQKLTVDITTPQAFRRKALKAAQKRNRPGLTVQKAAPAGKKPAVAPKKPVKPDKPR